MSNYDLVVIGGGPGGYVAAIRAAQEDLKVALVEARELGGTCLNRGCIPTKTYLHLSRVYHEMLQGEEVGILASSPSYDMAKMKDKKEDVSLKLREGIAGLLKANHVDVYNNKATIIEQGKVKLCNDEVLETKNIIIATGAKPFVPPIPGADLEGVVTSDQLLDNDQNLKSLVIVGGGVIGVEMACVYANLGVQVTIIEAMDRLLATMDREMGQSLAMSFKKAGVVVNTSSMVKEIKETDGQLEVFFEGKKGIDSVKAEKVLIAIGRVANTDGLIGEGLDLKMDRGIVINDKFETSIPNVYAIGDVGAGVIQLAHVASAQGTNVVDYIQGHEPTVNMDLIPACVYTNPEIAAVGLTESQAKEQGLNVKVSKYLTTGNAKSIIEDLDRGFIKLIFDQDSGVLLGASLMCGSGTDIISQLTFAIGKKLTAKEIQSFIQPHPTFSEGVLEAAENFYGHAVHIAPARKR